MDCSTKSSLTKLYNSKVTYAWLYKRPLRGMSSSSSSKHPANGRPLPGLYHAGVVVEVEDGERWLIHKGENYGIKSDTVITHASCMSSKWEVVDQKPVIGFTVNDFMRAGHVEEKYRLIGGPNCQTAANGMWELISPMKNKPAILMLRILFLLTLVYLYIYMYSTY